MVTSEKALLEKLNRLIDDHLDNPSFTIDTICQKIGLSRSQLHRIVKEQAGLSISLYIRKRRLLKASQLLVDTDLRVSEIGDRVGITNPQNFSTYFIEEYKLSPSEFRKLCSLFPAEANPLTSPETIPDTTPLPHPDNPAGTRPGFRHRRGLLYGGTVLVLLLLLGTVFYAGQQNRPFSRPVQPIGNSLAVLPFVNLGDTDSNPACEGILDDIHTSVSLIKNLKVIARASSDQYKDSRKSIWQIGDELQVANVLKGSVLKTGDQLQVKVEIINTKEDIRLWVHTYRATYSEFFSLTDQIVQDVARHLDPKPGQGSNARPKRLPTRNLAAYQEYIKGKQLLLARSEDKLRASLTLLNHAIALDSTFADAYASRASVYIIMGDFGFLDKKTGFKLAEKNALEAIRLDGANGTAYGVLGHLYRLQYKWEQALITFQIALKHRPNDAQINFWYGIVFRSMGRFEQAIHYESKAVALNPLYPPALNGLISTCVNAGRYDLARKAIQDGELLFNDNYMYRYSRSFYHLSLRQYPQAVSEMQRSDSLSHSPKTLAYYRLYLRAKVLPKDHFVAELKTIAPTVENYHNLAYAYAGLEDKENCLKYLQRAVDHELAPDYLKVAPFFAFLHNDPRFIALLRQCNLVDPL